MPRSVTRLKAYRAYNSSPRVFKTMSTMLTPRGNQVDRLPRNKCIASRFQNYFECNDGNQVDAKFTAYCA